MNRTLTAAVALAAGLGIAGLAQAQTNTETPGQPSVSQQTAPSPATPNPANPYNPSNPYMQNSSVPGAVAPYQQGPTPVNPQPNIQIPPGTMQSPAPAGTQPDPDASGQRR
jgi:hypothetical protein